MGAEERRAAERWRQSQQQNQSRTHAAAQQAELARLHAQSESAPLIADRFGRPLMAGCHLVYTPPEAVVWHVDAIEPDLSLNAPVGRGRMLLTAKLMVPVALGKMLPQLILAGYPEPVEEAPGDNLPPPDRPGDPVDEQPPLEIVLTDANTEAAVIRAAELAAGSTPAEAEAAIATYDEMMSQAPVDPRD